MSIYFEVTEKHINETMSSCDFQTESLSHNEVRVICKFPFGYKITAQKKGTSQKDASEKARLAIRDYVKQFEIYFMMKAEYMLKEEGAHPEKTHPIN